MTITQNLAMFFTMFLSHSNSCSNIILQLLPSEASILFYTLEAPLIILPQFLTKYHISQLPHGKPYDIIEHKIGLNTHKLCCNEIQWIYQNGITRYHDKAGYYSTEPDETHNCARYGENHHNSYMLHLILC